MSVRLQEVGFHSAPAGKSRLVRLREGDPGHGSRGGTVTEFFIALSHLNRGSTIKVEGELDLFTAPRVEEAVEVCLDRKPDALHVDATGLSLLTTAGIKILLEAAIRCHDTGIAFTLSAGGHARRVLDLVGLWWLGVVDDGVRLQSAMREALSSYATLHFEGGLRDVDPL